MEVITMKTCMDKATARLVTEAILESLGWEGVCEYFKENYLGALENAMEEGRQEAEDELT